MRDIPYFSNLLNDNLMYESYQGFRNNESIDIPLHTFADTQLTPNNSYPYSQDLQGLRFIFPAVVQDSVGAYVHFGDWPNVIEKILGLCYYEKYGDNDYGLFIRGINTDLYTKEGVVDSYLSYVDTLDYDPASTKRVQVSGYCIAATTRVDSSKLSGYTLLSEAPVLENYQFYNLPATGITKDETTGICSMKLPGYDVTVSYHPDFGAAIKFGDLPQEKYASDLSAYQVRTGTQLANIGNWNYSGYTFYQTMNIDTGMIEGDFLIPHIPPSAKLDGKGSHFDSETKAEVCPAASYKIMMTLENSLEGTGIKSIGLIGSNIGTVQNLILHGNAESTYKTYTGGLNFGALVGWNFGGTVENCTSKVNMTLKGKNQDSILMDSYIGGLIGLNVGVCHSNRVEDCTILGTDSVVQSSGIVNIGGLVGSSDNAIEDCQVKGKIAYGTAFAVQNNDLAIGGLVGAAKKNIARSFVFASIGEGSTINEYKNLEVGGLLGNMKSENVSVEASGFAGNIGINKTDNKVNDKAYIGQFVGFTDNHDSFISCYGWTESSLPFNGQDKNNTVYNNCYYYGTDSSKSGLTATTSMDTILHSLQSPDGWQWQMDAEENVPILTKNTTP